MVFVRAETKKDKAASTWCIAHQRHYRPVSSRRGKHQAVQPGYLPRKYILAVTEPGDLVVDPWMGTGTTGVEALKLGRMFIGFDIVKEYVRSAEERLSEALGNLWVEGAIHGSIDD